jgi:hypothetical protein
VRKLLATVATAVGLVLTVAAPASASTSYYAPRLPWSTPINLCIGGALCGGAANTIIVSTPRTQINYVNVTANDNVGDKHKARLQVYVDGVLVGDQDVLQGGSVLYFPVHRGGATITLMSTGPGSGGDETYVNALEIL